LLHLITTNNNLLKLLGYGHMSAIEYGVIVLFLMLT
jgi:hypothetical protein